MFWPRKNPPPKNPDVLTTPRLRLRPAVISDFAAWKEIREKNRAYLQPFEPAWPEAVLEESFFRRRVERLTADFEHDRTYAFLIFCDSNLIGGININNVTRAAAQFASLGYWLDEASQGQGYMTEAAQAVCGFAFSRLRLMRLNAATLPHNRKSRMMLERVGFREEGYAPEYLQIDGRWQDHVLYGLPKGMNLGAPGGG
jgi:ribosomal-protein-alanine N-acetyltransferase